MWCPISNYGGVIVIRYPINILHRLWIAVSKWYSTLEKKAAARIGHSGVPLQPEYSGEGRDAQNEMLLCLTHAASFVSIVIYQTGTII